MSLQHIQAKQHVHRLVLQDGERARKEVPLYLDLSYMSATRKHHLNYTEKSFRDLNIDTVERIHSCHETSQLYRNAHLEGKMILLDLSHKILC